MSFITLDKLGYSSHKNYNIFSFPPPFFLLVPFSTSAQFTTTYSKSEKHKGV